MAKVPPRIDGSSALGVADFAALFGATTQNIRNTCSELISAHKFRYRKPRAVERDQIIVDVLDRINSGKLTVAGDEGAHARWERGWAENLREFSKKGSKESELVPKYIRTDQPLRLYQDYVIPLSADFELNWSLVFRHWLFGKYLRGADSVYEFGCGTGTNLAVIAKLFPDKKLFGLDWSKSSREIINKLGCTYGWKMRGIPFDLFAPNTELNMPSGSAVLTFSALEQTGDRYEKFLQFLLRKKPTICIHVEPIYEWYDGGNLVDFLARLFHKQRHYLEGFLPRIRELEARGQIEILRARRCYFGSLFTEAYSQIIWRPVARL